MKKALKFLLKLAIIFVICFIIIYLVVLAGAWKLFESQDPILIEVGFATILSIFVYVIYEILSIVEKRVKSLEERINDLERKQ